MWYSLSAFYTDKDWISLVATLKAERANENNDVICEYCRQPIYKKYDCIGHHIKELTLDNVNDCNISLNPKNIMLVHHDCHNKIHCRFGSYTRHVYIVYGSPLSGKTSYVESVATKDDLVVDLDKIREAITGGKRYERSNRVNDNVFAVRNLLYEMIKYKRGKFINAFIIGGFPYTGERERLAKELEAEVIYIDTSKEECLTRLECCQDNRDKTEWKNYINEWWNKAGC